VFESTALGRRKLKDAPAPAARALLSSADARVLERPAVYDLHAAHVNPIFTRLVGLMGLDQLFVRGSGAWIWDADGNRYLDFFGGFGCVNLGHYHPALLARLREFLIDEHPVVFQTVGNRYAAALAANLAKVTPGALEVTFLCSTGSEATEGALKLARKATGREAIVYAEQAYHGCTMGALSVTGYSRMRDPFAPLVPRCISLPFGDAEALEARLRRRDVAAFIVEPIQGHAGVIVPAAGYLKECARICRRYGTLLVLDEVQTCLGRTGTMFACEHDGVEPDVLTVGKSLGAGLVPLAAYITTRAIWKRAYGSWEDFALHTSTFGGNALGAALGLATLETIDQEGLLARARDVGAYLFDRLGELKAKHSIIREVRGRGLMVGVELAPRSGGWGEHIAGAMLELVSERLVTNVFLSRLVNEHRVVIGASQTDRHVFRIYPPLVATREQIDTFVEAFDRVCTELPNGTAILRRVAAGAARALAGKEQ